MKEGEKIKDYIPKMEFLQQDLELLDHGAHDEELTGLVSDIQKLVKKTKGELQNKQAAQKTKEKEVKK